MEQVIARPDPMSMARMTRLAACLSRPLEFVHDDHLSLSPLDAGALRRLSATHAFRRPMNRAVRESLGLSSLSLPDDLPDRLSDQQSDEDDLPLSLQLALGDLSQTTDLLQHCAATQLFPQIRACVLKSQRKQIEDLVTPAAFVGAIRQAQAFYPALAERSRGIRLEDLLGQDTNDGLHPVLAQGLATLLAFVKRSDRSLAALLALRFPRLPGSKPGDITPLNDAQSAELKRLITQRGLTW